MTPQHFLNKKIQIYVRLASDLKGLGMLWRKLSFHFTAINKMFMQKQAECVVGFV
jgi:hypothetical protein